MPHDDDHLRDAPPLFRLDAGWLFLAAGMALLAATVLIPAHDDLQRAELVLARAQAERAHSAARLANYGEYLDALDRADRELVVELAATHLNLIPQGRTPVPGMGRRPTDLIDTFAALEPAPPGQFVRHPPESVLYSWSTDDRRRLWLLAGGSLLTLIGLLPAGAGRRSG